MLPRDPESALVRISIRGSAPPAGSGFVCYNRSADSLVITCRKVVELALGEELATEPAAGAPQDPVLIDGSIQATVAYWPSDPDGLAVLSTERALSERAQLRPLGRRPAIGEAEIFSYQQIETPREEPINGQPTTSALSKRVPWPAPYEITGDAPALLLLQNSKYRIRITEDAGCPVADLARVVAVVDHLMLTSKTATEWIVARYVDELLNWPGRPADLFQVHRIFISYSRTDVEPIEKAEWALQLAGFEVWRDTHSLVPGDLWVRGLGQILDTIRIVLVFCSHDAASSEWVQIELGALASRPKRPKIIPVLLPGGSLFGILGGTQQIDFTDMDTASLVSGVMRAINSEPLAD
jgi:hypothetical protein